MPLGLKNKTETLSNYEMYQTYKPMYLHSIWFIS